LFDWRSSTCILDLEAAEWGLAAGLLPEGFAAVNSNAMGPPTTPRAELLSSCPTGTQLSVQKFALDKCDTPHDPVGGASHRQRDDTKPGAHSIALCTTSPIVSAEPVALKRL
jgi:hypothetical protein